MFLIMPTASSCVRTVTPCSKSPCHARVLRTMVLTLHLQADGKHKQIPPNSSVSEIIMTTGMKVNSLSCNCLRGTQNKSRSSMKQDIALPHDAGTPISFPYLKIGNIVSTLVYSVVTTHTRPCIFWRAGVCRLKTTGDPYLWGNVVGSSTEGPSRDSIHHMLLAHPKISDFDMSFWIQHDVVQLQIPAREQANVRAFPLRDLIRLQLVTQKDVCLAAVSVAPGW